MSDDFKDRIALVTGASRGLGFHVARLLAAGGAQVYAVARTLGGLEELDDAVRAEGGVRPTLLPLDITDEDGLTRLGVVLAERHGRLDLLAHCAIHAPPLSPVGHVALKDLDKALNINARAVQRLIRICDPLMMQAEAPRALFLTDPKANGAMWSPYEATKEAGLAFARAWAAERAKGRLEVRFHTPPPMPTALRARFFPGEGRDHLTSARDAAVAAVAALG